MITRVSKHLKNAKKKEPDIYHNNGVIHDAERFSLIDTVLDGEYNDIYSSDKKQKRANQSWLKKLVNKFIIRLSGNLVQNVS